MKAGMQKRGMEVPVMWFHTGNYTKLYENDAGSHDQRIAFAAATSCNSTAILLRPSSLSLKTFRDIFPLEPVK